MNAGRIVVAGLLAGLVMNVGEFVLNAILLKDDWDAAMAALGLPTMAGADIAVAVVITFLVGIGLVWLYAGLRPRFGPGMKTAVIAGFFAWLLISALPLVWSMIVPVFPSRLMMVSAAWTLFEIPIATAVGGWAYKESRAAPMAAA